MGIKTDYENYTRSKDSGEDYNKLHYIPANTADYKGISIKI